MKINSNQAAIVNIRGTQATAPTTASSATGKTGAAAPSAAQSPDKVVLSAKSREIERLKQALNDLPEVRPEKVALAKQKMKSGEFQIDASTVAQKLVDSLKRG